MVLVPVGESAVSISINGTERVNELISDDTTYNLSESFNTSISVNGSNQENYTQSNDSTYDVSASASYGTVETVWEHPDNGGYNPGNIRTSPELSGGRYRYECSQGPIINIRNSDGDFLFFNNRSSLTIHLPPGSKFSVNASEDFDFNFTLYKEEPQLSIGGVSKS